MTRFEKLAEALDSTGPTNSGCLDVRPWSWYTDDWRVVVWIRPSKLVPVTLEESPLQSLSSPATRDWISNGTLPYVRISVRDQQVSTSQICQLIDSIIQFHLSDEV